MTTTTSGAPTAAGADGDPGNVGGTSSFGSPALGGGGASSESGGYRCQGPVTFTGSGFFEYEGAKAVAISIDPGAAALCRAYAESRINGGNFTVTLAKHAGSTELFIDVTGDGALSPTEPYLDGPYDATGLVPANFITAAPTPEPAGGAGGAGGAG